MSNSALHGDRRGERRDLAIALLIVCFPLAWLFLNRTYYIDWNRHLWMIAYTGEYFRRHLSFPTTFNTINVVGLPFPVFYGVLFFPITGLLSAVTGASIALRLVLIGVFWLQCVQVAKLVRVIYPTRGVAWSVAAIVCFAVYPLTNLYNRNAITELVAVSLLVSACSIWLRVLYTGERPGVWLSASFAWLLMALSAGSHPITSVLGGGLFFSLLVVGIFSAGNRRRMLVLTTVNAALFVLVLSPWIYATLKFQRHLGVASSMTSLTLWPDSIDKWWIRLLPIPFDIRPLQTDNLRLVSTPYLDAQINAGLVILAGFLAFQVWRRLRSGAVTVSREAGAAVVCIVLAGAVCYASVSIGLWRMLPPSLAFFQFGYRLVTYVDLLLLGAVVLLLSALRSVHTEIERSLRRCLVAAVVLMTAGVVVKFTHVAAIQSAGLMPGISVFTDDRGTLRMMPAGLPFEDYRDKNGFAGELRDATVVKLPIGVRTHFGEAERQILSPALESIATNIEAFPWNRVLLDGREVPMSETYTTGSFLSIILPKSPTPEQHTLGYAFTPDGLYPVLRIASATVLIGWAAGLLFARLYLRRTA